MKFEKQVIRKSKRIRKINVLPSLVTLSASRINFKKTSDSKTEIDRIKYEANELLNKYGKVRISMVISDNYYFNKDFKYPHQGHTFAITRNENILKVYDICEKNYKKKIKDSWYNYRKIIIHLLKDRKLIYSPLIPKLCKLCKKYEGSCQKYINLLYDNNLII